MSKNDIFSFTVVARLFLRDLHDGKSSKHEGCQFILETSPDLDEDAYYTGDDLNADGTKAVTSVLVSALSANLHQAHQSGVKDSAEHLREIIKELESQFIQPATITGEWIGPKH